MAPSEMEAIKVIEKGVAEIRTVPLPKHIDYRPTLGAMVGCDYAGTVEEVGSKVTKPWKKVDRISGFVHGVNSAEEEDGCFAEYCVAKGDVQMKIPSNISFGDAATLGVGVSTVGHALYQSLKLSLPSSPAKVPIWLFVYGGTTATGSLAIQYAKLSGLKVVTACSPHHKDYVKSLGAEEAFDYKDLEVGKKLIWCNAISTKGGTINNTVPAQTPRKDVEAKNTLGYTIFGEAFTFAGNDIPAAP